MSTPSAAHAYLQLSMARQRVQSASERLDAAFERHQRAHKAAPLDMSDRAAMARRGAADDVLARALEDYQQALRTALGTYSLMPLRPPW